MHKTYYRAPVSAWRGQSEVRGGRRGRERGKGKEKEKQSQ